MTVVIIVLLLLILKPITCIIHELSHAIPSLILTNGPVKVYINPSGENNKSIKLPFGRLTIFLQFKPIAWGSGLCQHSLYKKDRVGSGLKIALFGPFFGFVLIALLYLFPFGQWISYIVYALTISTFINFLFSSIPYSIPEWVLNGKANCSDCEQVRRLYVLKDFRKEIEVADQLYQKEEFSAAILDQKLPLAESLNKQDITRYF